MRAGATRAKDSSERTVIEIVTLDRIQPLLSQKGGSNVLAQLRNGQAIEGKVLAMLDGTMARLQILNQTIDVSIPRALQPGTAVSIMLDSDGGALKLLAQTGAQAARPQSAGDSDAVRLADALMSIAAQMALNEALSASEAFAQNSSAASGRPDPNPLAASLPPGAANLPPAIGGREPAQDEIRNLYGLPPPPQAYNSARGWLPSAPLLSSFSAAQAQQALLPPGGQAAANSGAGLIIPFQLPQMAQPVMIAVKEEESEPDRSKPRPGGKRWTVAVSLNAGAMGFIDVNIGLHAGTLSVSLAAHQAQSVSHLAAWLPELKAVLEQSGFAVEELSVRETPASADGGAAVVSQPVSL